MAFVFTAISCGSSSSENAGNSEPGTLPPTNLSAASPSPGNIQLFWNDNSDNETNFVIERKTADSDFAEISRLGPNTTTYLDGSLQIGQAYSYRVRALNNSNTTNYTNEITTVVTSSITNCHYIRAGAAGSNDGSNWTNAWTDLPDTFQRGHTYYVASGTYGQHQFRDVEDGNKFIFIKKATQANHGTDTGWLSSYATGQAVFQPDQDTDLIYISRSYYDFDGQTGKGNGTEQHGFKFCFPVDSRFTAAYVLVIVDETWSGQVKSYINLRHCELHHRSANPFLDEGVFTVESSGDRIKVTDASVFPASVPVRVRLKTTGTMPTGLTASDDSDYSGHLYNIRNRNLTDNTVQIAPFSWDNSTAVITGMTAGSGTHTLSQGFGGNGFQVHSQAALQSSLLQHCYIHDIPGINIYFCNSSGNNIIEYCHVARNHSDIIQHGEAIQNNPAVLSNIVRYSVWEDIEGTATMTVTAGWEIYGNVFFFTNHYPNSGQNGGYVGMGTVTSSGNNIKYYNNTVYGVMGGSHNLAYLTGTGNVVQNNIFVSCLWPSWQAGVTYDYNGYYDLQNAAGYLGSLATSEPHSNVLANDPFINSSSYDFHLANELQAGIALPAPYNRDMDGKIRGSSGIWSVGAYQYQE